MKEDEPKFKITSVQGFHITFKNGVTVSVQFGEGNYCANRYVHSNGTFQECPNSDVAVWSKEGYLNIDNGHVTPDEALKIMNWAAGLTQEDIMKIIKDNQYKIR